MRSLPARAAAGAALLAVVIGCANPAPTPSPSAPGASSGPVTTPGPDATLAVDLPFADDPLERAVRLFVRDGSGWLLDARGATADEQALVTRVVPAGELGLAMLPDDPAALVVTWAGTICDTTAWLSIDESLAGLTVEGGPVEPCDAMAVGRGVVLRFDAPVDPADLVTLLLAGPVEDVIARREAETAALLEIGGHDWVPTRALLAAAGTLDDRLEPSDRLVWAVTAENGGLPGSCPSAAADVDPLTADPCSAAGQATIYLDAATGAYLGVSYGGD